jgi:DNA repair protein RecN (Recombination protein N)
LLQNAIIELEEALYSLRQFQGQQNYSPERLLQIEERLSQIFKIKRKYGESEEELLAFQKKSLADLHSLNQLEERIEKLQEEQVFHREQCDRLAADLSEKRRNAALVLEKKLANELPLLNMGKAECTICVQKSVRKESGDDEITFFLKANEGEKTSPLSQCASGGELARICFALKILLSEKNRTPLLLFDEIDANIGGATATIIGEKLKELSQKKQLFAVTHFVQVATSAQTHLLVQKKERNGRTISSITELDEKSRAQEYTRMIGLLHKHQEISGQQNK